MTAPPAGALEACLALLEPAAAYGRGCNVRLEEGEPLYTADQMREYALLAALRLREWRPIESAPKDGFILVTDGNDHWVAWWSYGCWAYATDRNGDDVDVAEPLTHWMPLPAPPTADDLARVLEESSTGDEAGEATSD